jgi:3-hydroxyacyl-[acyl-carrier-protein] dehydratase
MRWFWIDRFTEFVSGQSAAAIKNISMSEEVLDGYAPPRAFFPTSLIVEGLAQTGGLLIGQMSDFRDKVVLAKISSSKFHCNAEPGDTLTYRVQIQNQEGIGSVVTGTSHVGDKLQAEIELMFASLDDARFKNVELFEPAQFCRMIRQFKLFDVAVNPDGSPVAIPDYMLQAERDYLNIG